MVSRFPPNVPGGLPSAPVGTGAPVHDTELLPASEAALVRVVEVLRRDGVVAVPTETVYGLAARGLSAAAVAEIYRAKGRPSDNPLILHVDSTEAAFPLWVLDDVAEDRARRLAAAFWPGPLTIVADASALVPDAPRAGLPKVAVRVPAHPFARAVAKALGEPFAAPSANLSGRPSPTTAREVLLTLDRRIDLVVDGGRCERGIESSVVDVSGARPRLLRPGSLDVAALLEVLPDLQVREPGLASHTSHTDHAGHISDASPGLRHRHYAPLGGASLLKAEGLSAVWGNEDVGVICREQDRAMLGPRRGWLMVLPGDVAGFANAIFSALYRAEREGVSDLRIVDVPADDIWLGVRDRLLRATA